MSSRQQECESTRVDRVLQRQAHVHPMCGTHKCLYKCVCVWVGGGGGRGGEGRVLTIVLCVLC